MHSLGVGEQIYESVDELKGSWQIKEKVVQLQTV